MPRPCPETAASTQHLKAQDNTARAVGSQLKQPAIYWAKGNFRVLYSHSLWYLATLLSRAQQGLIAT